MADLLYPLRIVTLPRGSWRWLWKVAGYATGKCSLPQLRRLGHGGLPKGGLHNRPVTGAALDFLSGLAVAAGGVDWRPPAVIPEDCYA